MDTAEAMAEERGLAGEAFNFSNEEPLAVSPLVERILKAVGRTDLEPEVLNQASNEIREQFLSAEKARTRLGWRPRFTLDEGLARTVEWYRKQIEDGAL
jgi:CDP-glucose 4,6-dehydratase